jgi:type I restriction enzyme R subunit
MAFFISALLFFDHISNFVAETGVDRAMLTGYISEYEFSYIIDEGDIRDSITEPMGLLKKKSLVRKIVEFIKSFAEKYQ